MTKNGDVYSMIMRLRGVVDGAGPCKKAGTDINLERFWLPVSWRDTRISTSAAQLGPVLRHVYTFGKKGPQLLAGWWMIFPL